MQIRRTLAIGALSAVALTGFAGTAANAEVDLASVDCTTVDAHIDAKKVEFETARDTFTSPLGQLIKAERAEARDKARESRQTLKGLVKELKKADDRKEARETAKAMRKESRQLAAASRTLNSRKELREHAKQAKRDARAEWNVVKADLRTLRAFKEACGLAEDAEVTEPTQPTQPTETTTSTEVVPVA